jgi:hypothetical protein
MASTLNQAAAITRPVEVERAETSEGLRFARYRALEELPGLAFGVVTVVYIFMSLAKLAL